jgi:hypothetical protein
MAQTAAWATRCLGSYLLAQIDEVMAQGGDHGVCAIVGLQLGNDDADLVPDRTLGQM